MTEENRPSEEQAQRKRPGRRPNTHTPWSDEAKARNKGKRPRNTYKGWPKGKKRINPVTGERTGGPGPGWRHTQEQIEKIREGARRMWQRRKSQEQPKP